MIAGPEPLVSISPPGGGPHPSRRLPAKLHLPFKSKAFFLAVLIVCMASAGARAERFKAVRVADGDTITILRQGDKVRVRLVGIDAPETSKSKRDPGQPYSQKSKQHLAGLVLNKQVSVKSYGRDRYGRILGGCSWEVPTSTWRWSRRDWQRCTGAGRPRDWTPVNTGGRRRRQGRNIWSLGDRYVSPKAWRQQH